MIKFYNRRINSLIVFTLLLAISMIILMNDRNIPAKLFPRMSIDSSSRTSTVNASKWKKNRLVIIPAVYREIEWHQNSTWPRWLREGLDLFNTNPSRAYDVYLYQRLDPDSKPPFNWPYCRNVHEEAGLYLKFIFDFYHDLPDRMLFIHAKPEQHSLSPIEAAQCIRDDVFYTSVNNVWFGNRPWIAGSPDPTDNLTLMYKCARHLLGLFGFDGEAQLNPDNHIPKDQSIYSTMCCAQFYVRKERIRHYTYQQWSAIYNASLQLYCTTMLDREIPGTFGVRSFGSAMEFLWHIILGLESTNMPPPKKKTNTDLCHLFRSGCSGSLCNAVVSGFLK